MLYILCYRVWTRLQYRYLCYIRVLTVLLWHCCICICSHIEIAPVSLWMSSYVCFFPKGCTLSFLLGAQVPLNEKIKLKKEEPYATFAALRSVRFLISPKECHIHEKSSSLVTFSVCIGVVAVAITDRIISCPPLWPNKVGINVSLKTLKVFLFFVFFFD